MKSTLFMAAAAAALALGAGTALAQDINAQPAYGSVTLEAGFPNDPYSLSMTAGGSIDASRLGGNCVGRVANAPDLDLYYTAGNYPLTIYVTSDADTTLVVNGPEGTWYCNDDADGLNPSITFNNPQSGLYDIWVGTYGDGMQSATLLISELAPGGGGGGASSGAPDYSLDPTYGSVTLSSGFTPDPHEVNMTAGGTLDAGQLGANCVGRIATAPDYRLYYTPGTYPLYIAVNSGADTTLAVNMPDGSWVCDDDSGSIGTNPLVTLSKPLPGRYDIYVGTYGSDTSRATLTISEIGD